MNVELLEAVAFELDTISDHSLFQMEHLAIATEHGPASDIAGTGLRLKGYAPVFEGGIAQFYVSPKGYQVFGYRVAVDLFQLTDDEASRLFEKDRWPDVFRSLPDNPQIAARRIRYFIKTGGTDRD